MDWKSKERSYLMKLQKVTLKNFRGTRGEIPLKLSLENGCSVLIYGDNGTGKSSLTDAIEWIATDKVQHLSGAEVETHGGLKNTFATKSDESYVELEFTNNYVLKKNLIQNQNRFTAKFFNPESDKELADILKSEHLLIRYKDLIQFIISTAGNRLTDLSNIIGFHEVTETKNKLLSIANGLKSQIKIKNYEELISNYKNNILEKIKATVNSRDQLYAAITSELRKHNIECKVINKETLNDALNELKQGVDEEAIVQRNIINTSLYGLEESLTKTKSALVVLSSFAENLKKLKSDKEKISNISIIKLLEEGEKILSSGRNNECPLCETNFDRVTLLTLIRDRLKSLQELQDLISNMNSEKQILQNTYADVIHTLENALDPLKVLNLEDFNIEKLRVQLEVLKCIHEVMSEDILAIDHRKLNANDIDKNIFVSEIQKLKTKTQTSGQQESEKRVELYSNLKTSVEVFDLIVKLEKEKEAIQSQKETMDLILNEFNEVRKNEMNAFLNDISSNVNDYYLYMNSSENVDEIKLIPTLKDNELIGISIELNFHGKPVSSPKKFLSESYINCLGLCIFLASVKLFNNKVKFFILDDVISSFDKPHRIRFGQLLLEKFSDYQVITLTHEQEWFEIMQSAVKGKGWKVTRTKWSLDEGTYLELPSFEIKEEIELLFQKGLENGLGNKIRRYAEKCFKELSLKLEVPLSFRYNDKNEDRMLGELFPSVVSRVNKKSSYLKDKPIVKKLENSSFISTKASHDSSFNENIDDLRVVFKDFIEFYNLFYCDGCERLVDSEFINKPKKTISCKCGKTEFEWR